MVRFYYERFLGPDEVVSPSGHGVASIPIQVLYSHAGPVGTAEDLSSQTTNVAKLGSDLIIYYNDII